MKVSNFLKEIEYIKIVGPMDLKVNFISEDSRKVKEGSIFVAIDGLTVDGHDFVDLAIGNGCRVIVHEKDLDYKEGVCYIQVSDSKRMLGKLAAALYDYPSRKMKVVGITGTNGKTTTSLILKHLLEEKYKLAVIGTNGIYINGEKRETQHTTPSADVLQGLFYDFNKMGVEIVIMEVSSHALEMGRVEGVDFDIAVFTNLSKDHLDLHGTMEEYYQAKKKLFSMVNKMVINTEDSYGARLYKELRSDQSLNIITSGFNQQDISLTILEKSNLFTKAMIKRNSLKLQAKLPFIALYNLSNMLEALAVCDFLKISLFDAIRKVEKFPGAEGRFERIENQFGLQLIMDFAHSPDALKNLLAAVDRPKGNIYLVFGVAGDRTKEIRREMGEVAGLYADYSFVTVDDPRVDSIENINRDIVEGLEKVKGKYEVILDRKEAIQKAIQIANRDDIVFFAGKSGDKAIHYLDYTEPYNELDTIKKALSMRKQ